MRAQKPQGACHEPGPNHNSSTKCFRHNSEPITAYTNSSSDTFKNNLRRHTALLSPYHQLRTQTAPPAPTPCPHRKSMTCTHTALLSSTANFTPYTCRCSTTSLRAGNKNKNTHGPHPTAQALAEWCYCSNDKGHSSAARRRLRELALGDMPRALEKQRECAGLRSGLGRGFRRWRCREEGRGL